ncbi:MAG: DUF58 domain-containing protein [Planctomycetota bacterium]|nr:MAG: DUF58 domain-containing protein [Planctomycetota bacterium]
MARPRQIRFTREGLYYTVVFLAVLLGAVGRQLNLLMLVGCLLAGPLVFSLFYGRFVLRRLPVERKLPSHLHAGERLRVDCLVENCRRWFSVWAVRVEDTVERMGGALPESSTVGVFFPRVAACPTQPATYEGRLERRGRYQFGPLRLSTRFPLGLVRHSLLLQNHAEMVVHPRLGTLSQDWVRMIREDESGSQQMTRRGMLEADFYGLREWRPGDSRRWIHWRTSARRGSLIVRQFEQRRNQNLALLLDLWRPSTPSDDDLEAVETAVSFAATLLAESCRKPGAQLALQLASAAPVFHSGSGSPLLLSEQMDILALAEPHDDEAFPPCLGHALALVPAWTTTFVISTRQIDWDALRRAAAERDTQVDARKIHAVSVTGKELPRYFRLREEAPLA